MNERAARSAVGLTIKGAKPMRSLNVSDLPACDYCGAAAGEQCRTVSGALAMQFHEPRQEWIREVWRAQGESK